MLEATVTYSPAMDSSAIKPARMEGSQITDGALS
ncbi:hypothetical protein FHR32_008423 [Streptosporangium album]|uniref:Uncharacterized protein n=1 Tax=Streptosporangium album TaxID=47479 RepID=A0A7W7WDS8_9ACTN|nr:hypothetical protein [Streptosporangium album]